MFREISLLVLLPLILMSVSLAVVGTHTMKIANIPRPTKIKQESTDIQINCDGNLCHNIKNLEHSLFEFEKIFLVLIPNS
ncbi:hypothetical protein C5F50_02625 [Nitrosopumilus ureiphilus]|uniref:Uncharacterized protein n=2 Tax=Nitrosopumilus ureiphilus TaxID=1470067 RepID=A0A7D5M3A8_9ARCH|nr:hypothetical protein C5F50_02625 [Nitrosopumilus ureiphilus]